MALLLTRFPARALPRARIPTSVFSPFASSIRPATGIFATVLASEKAQVKPVGQDAPVHTGVAKKPAGVSEVLSFPFARVKGLEPAPEFARLRKENPVCKIKMWDNSEPWLVTRYKDVCEVLSDERFSKIRTLPNFPELNAGGKLAAKAGKPTFVDMDRPEHTKQRGTVEPFFSPEAIQSMRPRIQKTVDENIQQLLDMGCKEPVDFVDKFAMRIPYLIIAEMLGVPPQDMEHLIRQTAVRASGSSTAREASQASQELTTYIRKLVDQKEKNPGDHIVSRLIVDQLRNGNLDKEDIVQISFLLFVAGNATVAGTIAMGLVTLLEHPDQLAELKKDPSLSKNLVQELCRYHTGSALATRRVAKEDVQIGGQTIKAGEGVIASNQSANRDETIFPNPDKFDIHRPEANKQVGFGYGIHECVAMWLALAEMECVFETLFKKMPNLHVAIPLDQIKYSDPTKDVGILELPVVW
ncbi:hypothetical protein HK102_004794 [Quaeritorhiza haematococci]|nr:hypothetical protein HK102_004794 [Quaeritorhiza haematococci]